MYKDKIKRTSKVVDCRLSKSVSTTLVELPRLYILIVQGEDYPGGEVCQEQEVEVCQLSNGVEDKLCPEVEVHLQCNCILGNTCGGE